LAGNEQATPTHHLHPALPPRPPPSPSSPNPENSLPFIRGGTEEERPRPAGIQHRGTRAAAQDAPVSWHSFSAVLPCSITMQYTYCRAEIECCWASWATSFFADSPRYCRVFSLSAMPRNRNFRGPFPRNSLSHTQREQWASCVVCPVLYPAERDIACGTQ